MERGMWTMALCIRRTRTLCRHVTIGTPMVIFAVWLFLTIGTLLFHLTFVFRVMLHVFSVMLHMFHVMSHVFPVMLDVFLVMLQVFCLMLHMFCVMLQVFLVMLQVFRVMLQETCATLQETRATLQKTPATLHETRTTLNETRATLHETQTSNETTAYQQCTNHRKQSNSKNDHWCTNGHMSTQSPRPPSASAEYTKPWKITIFDQYLALSRNKRKTEP